MKKITILLLCMTWFSNAQIVDIPDANLKAKLIASSPDNNIAEDLDGNDFSIDANNDGEIQVEEALATSYLYLSNDGIADMTGIEAFTNLRHLNCFYNDIENLDVSALIYLDTLKCGYNPLGNLDVSQNIDLVFLSCYGNQLSNLDVSQNINLERLECTINQLTSIDVSQNTNLNVLAVGHNPMSSLDVTQNINLLELYCHESQLSTIDLSQNVNLEKLYSYDNPMDNGLDLTQNMNLKYLHCYNSQLSDLDVVANTNLEDLYCYNNQISTIDLTQNTNLVKLKASNNQITSIDVSNNTNLEQMEFEYNQLDILDISNNPNIQYLTCRYNQLTSLFIKNGNVDEGLAFNGNENLEYICADEAQVAQIQDANPDVLVNSYCSFSPGGNYNTISGSLVFDANNDGCDSEDDLQPHIRVDINDGITQGSVFSNGTGNYTFFTDAGDFSITPIWENNDLFTITPSTITIPFSDNNNNVANQDFCIVANGIYNDVEVLVLPIEAAQPGFDASYQIVYKNKGNQMLSGSIDLTFSDAILDYVSASIAPDMQIENNLSWNYSDLLPFETRVISITLNVNSPMEIPAVNNGDILDFNVSISPISGDETPIDNSFDYQQTVVGSYDPNDITCLEGDLVNPEQIGEYLHYNVNFENTGTAAATFIVVKDGLDNAQFDINSMQVLYSSHSLVTRIIGNTVEFIFDNINLAPEGRGNVVFKIKTKADLVLGDFVENKAEIFFDYNFPIETNVATTVFDVLSINEYTDDTLDIFPNPSSDIVNIRSTSLIKSIQIYDVQGRLITSLRPDQADEVVQISELNNGIYFLKVKTDRGEGLKKIIKN